MICFEAIGPCECLVELVWWFQCDLNFSSKWSFFMFSADMIAKITLQAGILPSTNDLYSRWDGVVSSSAQREVGIESQIDPKHANYYSHGILPSVMFTCQHALRQLLWLT